MSNSNRFVFFLLLMFTLNVSAQVNYSEADFNFIGVGARAKAMGNSQIAFVNDEHAIFWNPAGLTQLKDMSRISLSALMNHRQFTENDSSLVFPAENDQHATLNFFGFASPIPLKIGRAAVGFGFYKALDFYSTEANPENAFQPVSSGGVDVLAPALAFAWKNNIAGGLSFNFYQGKYRYRDGVTQDFKHIYDGFNVTLGLQMHRNDFSFGALFRTPFDLKISQPDSTIRITMPAMFGLGFAYRLGEDVLLAADYEVRFFSNSRAENEATETIQIIDETACSGEDWIDWENSHILRTGLEYRIRYGKIQAPLRWGLARIPHPTRDGKNLQIHTWSVTGGFGIQTDNIQIDLGADYGITNWSEKLAENIFVTRMKNSITMLVSVTIIWTNL
ncbi:MAG: OmpP1/FadL family transporter [Candidatus Zhuqueibacterota bacterium]